jgi:hypothetical protein
MIDQIDTQTGLERPAYHRMPLRVNGPVFAVFTGVTFFRRSDAQQHDSQRSRSLSEKCCFGDCGAGILACTSLKNGEASAAKDGRTTILRTAS